MSGPNPHLLPRTRPLSVVEGGAKETNLLLDQYLAKMDRRLIGIVPDDERQPFIEEVRCHLEQSIRSKIESGKDLLTATEQALSQYGGARRNAEDFLSSWYQYTNRTPMTRVFGRANLVAYGWLQMMEVLCLLILEVNVFLPSYAMYRLPWKISPAQVRQMWPEPLPFPDFTPSFLLTLGFPIIAPIIAGWIIGRSLPVGAASAVYRALTPLILVSFVMGALLLPTTTGLLFALFQVAFWLPVGCLTAHISSLLARRSNYKAHNRANKLAHS